MFEELNASHFKNASRFRLNEFEELLSKIIDCYELMIADNLSLENNENSIRNSMVKNYLKKQWFKIKLGLTDYLFDYETPEEQLPEDKGRIDIRIMPINPFVNDDAYFIIECKRLDSKNQDGTSGLNGEYVKEGISRFVSKKYSTYHKTNGMIGFIVQSIDIEQNVIAINRLLNGELNTTQNLRRYEITSSFNFSYRSIHKLYGDEITIYHLMFDFSKHIKD